MATPSYSTRCTYALGTRKLAQQEQQAQLEKRLVAASYSTWPQLAQRIVDNIGCFVLIVLL